MRSVTRTDEGRSRARFEALAGVSVGSKGKTRRQDVGGDDGGSGGFARARLRASGTSGMCPYK